MLVAFGKVFRTWFACPTPSHIFRHLFPICGLLRLNSYFLIGLISTWSLASLPFNASPPVTLPHTQLLPPSYHVCVRPSSVAYVLISMPFIPFLLASWSSLYIPCGDLSRNCFLHE